MILPCLLPALLAQAPSAPPPGLAEHLREAAVVHADFTQVRVLAALSRPLKASGSLVMARDRGVIWRIEKPISMTYVMGPQGLMTVDGEGRKTRKAARDLPVLGQLGAVFQAMVQGDWKALAPTFTVTGKGTLRRWDVALTPTARTAGFLQGIQVSGGAFVERIVLQEAGGDRMEIAFSHPRADAPVSEAEGRLLAQD